MTKVSVGIIARNEEKHISELMKSLINLNLPKDEYEIILVDGDSSDKTIEKANDFQLEFYYLLASAMGNVTRCAFYDLKDVKIVAEEFMAEKLSILESKIKEILQLKEINFEMCEDTKKCIYCDYATTCLRV